jgi:hypothetical protein
MKSERSGALPMGSLFNDLAFYVGACTTFAWSTLQEKYGTTSYNHSTVGNNIELE